jgi:hypothetical protein
VHDEPTDYTAASDAVARVVAWYTAQISAERSAAAADQDRLRRLVAERGACVADQRALDDADEEELARVTAAYEARLSELTDP